MDAANCAAVLLSVPISYHFHGWKKGRERRKGGREKEAMDREGAIGKGREKGRKGEGKGGRVTS